MGHLKLNFGLLALLLSFAFSHPSVAGQAGATKEEIKKKNGTTAFEFNKKDPIYITADWMEVDQKKNTITYKGRVVTVQADMTMRSETLTAVYDPDMKQMKQIVAEGRVQATQGNRFATGEKAIFDEKTKTVTLTGNPVMRQGNSQVTGTRIIYFVDQDRAVAEGKDQIRVVATIFPEELQKQDKGEAGPSKER
jgi:lipopolysaccharide export system protein LptA